MLNELTCSSRANIARNNENDNMVNEQNECKGYKLKLGNLNVRSLYPKIDQLETFVKTKCFDIIGINETWLDKSVDDMEIKIPGFSVVRKDRNKHGGGVCFYICDGIQYCTIDNIGNGIESLWLSVKQRNKKHIVIGTIYRAPNSNREYCENIFNEIQRAKDISEEVIVMGDLNFDCISDNGLSQNPISCLESMFDMTQLIKMPTRITLKTKSLLDVIITSNYKKHCNTTVIDISMSDHCCVYTEYGTTINFEKLSKPNNEITFKNYKQFNLEAFKQELSDSHFVTNCDFENSELEHRWKLFMSAFLEISNKHVPSKTMRLKDRCSPWVSNDTISMMYRRDFLKRKAVKNNDEQLWKEYRELRNDITKKIKSDKKKYYTDQLKECGKNPQKVWKFINKVTGGGKQTQPPSDLSADAFNVYFSTIGEKIKESSSTKPVNLPWKNPPCSFNFRFSPVNEEWVKKALMKLNSNSNVDILGFDRKLLRCSAEIISPIICKFFNASLITSTVISDWKMARVTPVFKEKGDKSDFSNYRPISVIGHISKLFEMVIHRQLLEYFHESNLISLDQSAYLKHRNTQTALHRVIDDWTDNICSNNLTGICSFDIKKCFDTIDHQILLLKLEKYGITNSELNWFRSYLADRCQIVRCNNKLSEKCNVTVGVPQGSTLGPLLFIVFINDLSQHVGIGTANLFADDTLIYCNALEVSELNDKLQKCVNDVVDWYKHNNIVINAEKSCSMVVRSKRKSISDVFKIVVDDCEIDHVKSMNYLGLELEETLTWNKYISKLCKKLAFKISKLSRLSKSLPKSTLLKIYNSMIQPNLDYAISVWGCTSQANLARIQRLQNYAARIIERNFDFINIRGQELVYKLGWMTVKERFFYFQTLLIFKCIYGMAPHYLTNNVIMEVDISNVQTRKHLMNLHLPLPDNEFHKTMLFYRGASDWNDLPSHLKDCHDLNEFKRKMKCHIKQERVLL